MLVYCQTGIHNPTGTTMSAAARAELGVLIGGAGVPVIEDCCSYDLTRSGLPAGTLAGHVDDRLQVMVGSLSKLFWGGLRVGWIRADASRIRSMLELRKAQDLSTSVVSQLLATRLMGRADEARLERRKMLSRRLGTTRAVVNRYCPNWDCGPIRGGTGLWMDTGADVLLLAEAAKRVKVRLAPGPSFSPHDGQTTMLRLPIWHTPEVLEEALRRLQ